ncbi:unnamed protein product [Cylicocyclus nassatus]|uniref:Histone H2A n=1 Tax=Cylicocyclus nassatus TaxID=53992 RepID=A0AA36MIR0_CYLNA|nr:unnamed protein product [Cylicocyclus nassatus]
MGRTCENPLDELNHVMELKHIPADIFERAATCSPMLSSLGKGGIASTTCKRSRSSRAGLQFSVARVERMLRKGNYARRISGGAPVFLAAVIEYLVAEDQSSPSPTRCSQRRGAGQAALRRHHRPRRSRALHPSRFI